MNKLRTFLVTGCGTGYLPWAPGTWGSAAVCSLFLLVCWGSGGSRLWVDGTLAALLVGACITCVALGRFTEQTFGGKDPGACTIDEWAGQALALTGMPLAAGIEHGALVAAVSLAAFRLFDITKPPPARQMERRPRGWGVLLDDLIAGLYANITTQLVLRLGLL